MKISIITINFNNKSGLERTIGSVINQTYNDYEYIVVDGGSADGSLEVIKGNSHNLKYWISEKDNGIYDAMNKGIVKSNGQYCLFLNSGDWLVDENVLSNIVASIFDEPDIIYGNLIKIDPKTKKQFESKPPASLSFYQFYIHTLPHQAALIKSSLFKEIGLYNEEYKIVADWAFFTLAVCKYRKTAKYIDMPISYFVLDGVGSVGNYDQIDRERSHFLKINFPIFLRDYDDYSAIKDLRILKCWNVFKKTFIYRFLKKVSSCKA